MEAILNRNLTSCDVSNHLRNEERIELRTIGLVYAIVLYFFLEGLNSTDTYAKDHTDAVFVFSLEIHLTVFDSLLGGNHGQLGIAVHLTSLLAVDKIVDIEVLHLTSELCFEFTCIKKCNRCCAANSVEQVVPHLFWSVADWCHCAQTCYNYSF